jgi:hypothetical protein
MKTLYKKPALLLLIFVLSVCALLAEAESGSEFYGLSLLSAAKKKEEEERNKNVDASGTAATPPKKITTTTPFGSILWGA